jgi:hypothetical protein
MAVFDKGEFTHRQRRKSDQEQEPKPKMSTKDWDEGFAAGYQSALDRYIKSYKN